MAHIDITSLTDHTTRANVMWDYQSNPGQFMADMLESLSDFADEDGALEALPEAVCGAYSATFGAAMLYDVYLRTFIGGAEPTMHDMAQTQAAADIITHAAFDHGDSLAIALRESDGTYPDTMARLEDWVANHLFPSIEYVLETLTASDDFDAWETQAATPTDAA